MLTKFIFKGAPMNEDQARNLMSFFLFSKSNPDQEIPFEKDEKINGEFLCQVMQKRIEHYPLPFNMTNLFVVMSFVAGVTTPGKAMILLWLAYCYYEETGKKILDIYDWAHIFHVGAPTEEEWHKFWQSQKIMHSAHGYEDGNMVDHPKFWGL